MATTATITVNSPNVKYTENYIIADYDYHYTKAKTDNNTIQITPHVEHLTLRTNRIVPKIGVMLVGWGGNNGSTFTAAILANKLGLSWPTRRGTQKANWFGSLTQASTVNLANNINIQLSRLLPMVHPDDIEIDGWDISSLNLSDAMERARVLEPVLQQQLKSKLATMRPRPSIYDADFIAANQADRVDNIIKGTKLEQIEQICRDIESFKKKSNLDQIIVLWTANTERFSELLPGINDTYHNLKVAIQNNHKEISPSTLFAYAAIQSKCVYINGSPQNTFVPGIIEMANLHKTFIAGDDFKSGQTKIKSVLVDFLVSSGIKPTSIVSYNHLGNNDGKNLSAPQQFRSKEITKSNVVDDMVESNDILYRPGEKPDHVVVIKYVPYVGDSKRAMDEYTSEIMMGGTNTIVVHNTCEDSLLATPIILDLIILSELCTRIEIKRRTDPDYVKFHSVLSILSFLCKAPLVPPSTPVVNALFRQRNCIENILKACLGLQPDSNMLLEYKVPFMIEERLDEEPCKKKVKIDAANGRH